MSEPAKPRKLPAAVALAVALAAPAEGLRQWAYHCPAGKLTVCYGSTTDVQAGRPYSIEECKAMLDAEMLATVQQVERCQPGLPDRVLAAFADAAYNIGAKVACDRRASTAARLLAAGRYEEACNQLPRWNRATVAGASVPLPGLTKRREAERRVCLGLA